jgi:nicotinamidase-related amidase
MLIERDASLLLVVDVQEKLAPAIVDGAAASTNNVRLLEAAAQLGIPSFVSEQYVRGLGPSLASIRQAAGQARFFEKTHFSCAAEPGITGLLQVPGRRQLLIGGMEAHVCVLQTAFGMQAAGFEVSVVADAVSSRTVANREAALERLRHGGIQIVTTEMVLFEWLHQAGTDEFRRLLPLIK